MRTHRHAHSPVVPAILFLALDSLSSLCSVSGSRPLRSTSLGPLLTAFPHLFLLHSSSSTCPSASRVSCSVRHFSLPPPPWTPGSCLSPSLFAEVTTEVLQTAFAWASEGHPCGPAPPCRLCRCHSPARHRGLAHATLGSVCPSPSRGLADEGTTCRTPRVDRGLPSVPGPPPRP